MPVETWYDFADYQADAQKTSSPITPELRNRMREHAAAIIGLLKKAKAIGECLDAYKKAVFYGKPLPPGANYVDDSRNMIIDDIFGKEISEDVKAISLIHGIMGLWTENAELTEWLFNTNTEHMDRANLKEEIGDHLWYLAELCAGGSLSLQDCAVTNIAKLRTRFPNRFTDENAINRNLAAERLTLEAERKTGAN